jgi:cellulose synthase/poly-beta-1,6-N-acetylglucosamine synthase-like glycosyltransferase
VTTNTLVGTDVTVVVPTYNEEKHIRRCLAGLQQQDVEGLRIFVVDGGSDDSTLDIVAGIAADDPRVQLLHNPRRTPAAAMNVGIEACRTPFLVRADAHSAYATDFVRRSLETLIETGAANVGGPMRPVGTNPFGRAVAAVTTSRFGIGWGAFHWTDRRCDVDTVYLGCWRIETLRALRGYDEHRLSRAGEDQELNFRIRQQGGRIVCDPSIQSTYFPRDTAVGLWRQYWVYGSCKATTLRIHRRLPSLRPVAPALLAVALVLAPVLAVLTGQWAWLAGPLAWALLVAAASVRMGTRAGVSAWRAALAMAICHVSYGFGFWSGALRNA